MSTPAIQIDSLHHQYGRFEAVRGLSLTVQPGRCYGFFGRNGAGKTTTIKCLLNLLQPQAGQVRVFGLDPRREDVAIKSRIAYVPDFVAFYPWMTVRQTLDYLASFRPQWNQKAEKDLLGRFRLDPKQKVNGLSKGQRTQLALTGAIAADPEMLVLDEPTSGLDPIIRREFIQTVIGAYQEIDPERRTIFVSTHLISEFEGLIDEFTIVEGGRSVLSLTADAAREQFQRVRARFAQPAPAAPFAEAREVRREGRELELIVRGGVTKVVDWLRAQSPEDMSVEALTLEEVFVSSQNSATA